MHIGPSFGATKLNISINETLVEDGSNCYHNHSPIFPSLGRTISNTNSLESISSSMPLIQPTNVTMLLIQHMDTQIQQNKVFNSMKD